MKKAMEMGARKEVWEIKKSKKSGPFLALLFLSLLISFFTLTIFAKAQNYYYYTPNQIYRSDYEKFFPAQTTTSIACNKTTNFLVYVDPIEGCQPTVVRSDLLEEQPVPVFCKLKAINLNPLLQNIYIKDVSIAVENKSDLVGGLLFHMPWLGEKLLSGYLWSNYGYKQGIASFDNLGYAVVYLKPTPESKMPDKVDVNAKARIRYSAGYLFGIDRNTFLIPELSDEEWQARFNEFSFFNGKGFIRVKKIYQDKVDVEIYKESINDPTPIRLTLIKDRPVKVGFWGFFCNNQEFEVNLDSLELPRKKARIVINGNEYLLAEREEAEGCRVESIEEGIIRGSGRVTVDCGGKTTTLEVSPLTVKIEKNGQMHSLSLGDRIKVGEEDGESLYAYLVCAKKIRNEKIAYFYLGDRKARYRVERLIRDNIQAKGGIDCSKLKDMEEVEEITDGGKIKDTNIKVKDIFESYDRVLNPEVEQAFEDAKEKYDGIFFKYKDERDESGEYVGAKALFELAGLAEKIGKRTEAINILSKLIKEYEGTDSGLVIKAERKKRQLLQFDYSKARSTLENRGNLWSLELVDIEAPYSTDIYAELEVNGEKDKYWLQRAVGEGWIVEEITDSYVKFKNVKSEESYGEERTIEVGREECVEANEGGCLLNIKVMSSHVKKIAQISVKPPDIEYVAETNFSIHIGIEKRAIKIAPEKALEAARKLNETIREIEKFNEKLGKITQTWTKACYVGGTALFLKNFLTGMSGEALARKIAMRGTSGKDGWTAICTEKVTKGEFNSLSQCFRENEKKINEDVGKIKDFIGDVNGIISKIEQNCSSKTNIEERRKCFYDKLKGKQIEVRIKIDENEIKWEQLVSKLKTLEEKGYFYKDQLKDVLLNLKIRNCKDCHLMEEEFLKNRIDRSIISYVNRAEALGIDACKNWREQDQRVFCSGLYEIERDGTIKAPTLEEKDEKVKNKIVKGIEKEIEKLYYSVVFFDNKYYYVAIEKSGGRNVIVGIFNYSDIIKIYRGESVELVKNVYDDLKEKIEKRGFQFVEAECNSIAANYRYASFFDKAPQSDRIGYMPVIAEQGWYVFVPNKPESYLESGAPNSYYICNVGKDSIPDLAIYGQADDDQCIYVTPENKQGIQNTKLCESQQISLANIMQKAEKCISQANQKKRQGIAIETDCGTFKVKKQVSLPTAQCEDFMSPSDCLKLFNLCDPVLCPPSRCDLGGRYPVDNVMQTGIIGSLVLCLPNFEGGKGVLMPVCLTGLHSGINFLNSMLKDTAKCLEVSAKTGKNIGICDQIKSIYLCDMLWRQLVPFLKVGMPSLISKVERKGGGEYATFSSTWQQTMQGLSYFYQVYGRTASEAFKIRSTAEAGSMICKKFLGVRYPNAASLLEEISKPAGPYQFFAKVDEFPFTQVTYPPQSHYKVFFQIYAGTDTDVYYAVYLRNPPQYAAINVPQQLVIDTGFIARGQSISKSPDLTAVSGYKEICININGKEECGFDVVSTSYAVNWLQDKYVEDQLKANIKTRKQCISGEPSLMPTATLLNLQAGIEKAISPAIYKQGIIRVCSSFNPGKGVSEEQWRAVGYCDDPNINCWVYLPSVRQAIKDLGLENQTIEWLEKKSKEIMPELAKEYLSPEQEQDVATHTNKFLDDKTKNYEELINNIEGKISGGEIEIKERNQIKNEIKNNIKQIEEDISEAEENISKILNPFLLKKLEQKLAKLYKQRALLKFYYNHIDELIQEAKERKEEEKKAEEKPKKPPFEEEGFIDVLPVDINRIEKCKKGSNNITFIVKKDTTIFAIADGKVTKIEDSLFGTNKIMTKYKIDSSSIEIEFDNVGDYYFKEDEEFKKFDPLGKAYDNKLIIKGNIFNWFSKDIKDFINNECNKSKGKPTHNIKRKEGENPCEIEYDDRSQFSANLKFKFMYGKWFWKIGENPFLAFPFPITRPSLFNYQYRKEEVINNDFYRKIYSSLKDKDFEKGIEFLLTQMYNNNDRLFIYYPGKKRWGITAGEIRDEMKNKNKNESEAIKDKVNKTLNYCRQSTTKKTPTTQPSQQPSQPQEIQFTAFLVSGNESSGFSNEGKTIDYSNTQTEICLVLNKSGEYYSGKRILINTGKMKKIGREYYEKRFYTKELKDNNAKITWQVILPKFKHDKKDNCDPTYKAELREENYGCSKDKYWVEYDGKNYEVIEYRKERIPTVGEVWCIKPKPENGTYWYRAVIEINGNKIYAGPRFAIEDENNANNVFRNKEYNFRDILTFDDYLKVEPQCSEYVTEENCSGLLVIDPRKAMRISRKSNYCEESKYCSDNSIPNCKERCELIEIAESYYNVPYVEWHPSACLLGTVEGLYLAAECASLIDAVIKKVENVRYTLQVSGSFLLINTLIGKEEYTGDVIWAGEMKNNKFNPLAYYFIIDTNKNNKLDKDDDLLYSGFMAKTVKRKKFKNTNLYRDRNKYYGRIEKPNF